jgi:hypothetical protein
MFLPVAMQKRGAYVASNTHVKVGPEHVSPPPGSSLSFLRRASTKPSGRGNNEIGARVIQGQNALGS